MKLLHSSLGWLTLHVAIAQQALDNEYAAAGRPDAKPSTLMTSVVSRSNVVAHDASDANAPTSHPLSALYMVYENEAQNSPSAHIEEYEANGSNEPSPEVDADDEIHDIRRLDETDLHNLKLLASGFGKAELAQGGSSSKPPKDKNRLKVQAHLRKYKKTGCRGIRFSTYLIDGTCTHVGFFKRLKSYRLDYIKDKTADKDDDDAGSRNCKVKFYADTGCREEIESAGEGSEGEDDTCVDLVAGARAAGGTANAAREANGRGGLKRRGVKMVCDERAESKDDDDSSSSSKVKNSKSSKTIAASSTMKPEDDDPSTPPKANKSSKSVSASSNSPAAETRQLSARAVEAKPTKSKKPKTSSTTNDDDDDDDDDASTKSKSKKPGTKPTKSPKSDKDDLNETVTVTTTKVVHVKGTAKATSTN